MSTFFKGLAVLLVAVWTAGGALMLLWQGLTWINGSSETIWTAASTGWWQFGIYGALIGWALLGLYWFCVVLGEWFEENF